MGFISSEVYYDSIAKGYDELHGQEQINKLNLASEYLEFSENDKLLDVGCGSGISTRFWNCTRTGIDPSSKLLEIAKINDPEGNYIHTGAENLPFEDNSFDIVVSFTAIQNFIDLDKGLNEIKRVGKNKFILTVLKKSPKHKIVREKINALFKVKEELVNDHDIFFII